MRSSWSSLLCSLSINNFSNGLGNRRRFEVRSIDADRRDIALRETLPRLVIENNKIVAQCLKPADLRVQLHSDRPSVLDRFGEFRKSLDARHPYAILLIRQMPLFSRRAKEFFLCPFDKTEEVREVNNSGSIHLRPVCLKADLKHDGGILALYAPALAGAPTEVGAYSC